MSGHLARPDGMYSKPFRCRAQVEASAPQGPKPRQVYFDARDELKPRLAEVAAMQTALKAAQDPGVAVQCEPEQATRREPEQATQQLKKSVSAGSAVFTLLARAGGTPGPPSRQTSREFAAEQGMLTPPGSAR